MIFRKKDPEGRPTYGTHPGDLGVVLIAALITLGFVYLLLTPQNFGAVLAGGPPTKTQPDPAARKGETPMMLFDAKKK